MSLLCVSSESVNWIYHWEISLGNFRRKYSALPEERAQFKIAMMLAVYAILLPSRLNHGMDQSIFFG